jgi:hypothetical protein
MRGKWEDEPTLEEIEKEYSEAIDIFPALHKYKAEHTTENLLKLCVEVAEFCWAIYASTQNEKERRIYFSMLDKLKNK